MIGGGHNNDPNAAVLKTTEIINLNGATKYGPPLPWEFYEHCVAMMVAQYVIIVGGFFHPTSTLIVDTFNFEAMFEGPQLAGEGRTGHACEHIKHSNGSNYVIVVGGYEQLLDGSNNYLMNSLILNVNDNEPLHSTWSAGKVTLTPLIGVVWSC